MLRFAIYTTNRVEVQMHLLEKILTIELPTQMVIVSSIRFFIAIHTEVTCSAAFA